MLRTKYERLTAEFVIEMFKVLTYLVTSVQRCKKRTSNLKRPNHSAIFVVNYGI